MELIAGVDEVGRGPLAGPVIACAVILPEDSIKVLKIQKNYLKKKRGIISNNTGSSNNYWPRGVSDVKTMISYNIREATFMAMKSALKKLDPKPDKAYNRW